MKNLKNRILSLITAFAVAFAGVTMPDIGILPGLAVTASAEAEFTEAATWTELKNALTAGGDVRLTGDVKAGSTDTALVVPEGKYVTLDLNGHTIDRGLTSPTSNGNVITVRGNLTLTDTSTGEPGTITGGNNNGFGGGVYVNGTFTMNGGTISGCSANNNGGGVYVNSGTFTMSGGTISGYSATWGGGVYVNGGGFTMQGGTISGCSAGGNGGGVYVGTNSTFNVSGAPVISGNTEDNAANEDDAANNVVFQSSHPTKTINVIGKLTADASIYVHAEKNNTVAVGGSDYTLTESDAEYFHSDNSRFFPVFVTEDNTNKVKLVGAWGALQSKLNNASTDATSPTKITLSGDVTAGNSDTALEVKSGTYVILDLNGHTIDRGLKNKNAVENGNVITVNGNLTLTDISTGGTITGGKKDGNDGGGVCVHGTFTMQGGTISECKTRDGYGYSSGGVYVENGAKFTMSGGTISGCSAEGDGGGVCVYGTFNMSGGEISSCSAKNGGGVGVGCYGTFNMSGGKILSCSARYDGGGVYVNSVTEGKNVYSGTFTMSGGTIIECKTTDNYGGGGGGGGVSVEGTFTMSDGTISDCSSVMDGGGVCVNGTFTMSDSTISGCSSVMNGGGVSVEKGGTFTMSDSTISGCSADQRGGGVYVDGTFTMQGGTISGCSAVMNGSGVYVYNSGTFNISGSPVISGNKKGDAANNVVATKTINVTDELDTDASVYVSAEKGVAVAVGGGYTLTESDAECFHSDIDAALASVLDNGKIVFKAELPELFNIGSATYNGNAQSPLLMFSGKVLTKDTDYTVSYKLGDTAVTEAKNAGTYTVTVTGIGAYHGTFEKSYKINKKPVTVSGITANEKFYDGTTDAEFDCSGATITGKFEADDLTVTATGAFADANAGTGKTVTISGLTLVGESAGNYVLAENGQQTDTTADIARKPVTVSATVEDKTYDGTTAATVTGTAAIDGKIGNDDVTVIAGTAEFADKNVGTDKTVTFSGYSLSGTAAGNYELSEQPASVTASITPKEVTVSGITASDKTYDGTTDAELDCSGATFDGICTGDMLTVTATGAFEDANAGTDKTVNITDITFGGTDAGNYVLAGSGQQTGITADITARAITIKATDQNVELNGEIATSTDKVSVSSGELVSGQSITAVTLTASSTDAVTKSGTITPSAATIKSGTTDVTANYDISYADGVLTVVPIKAKVMAAPTAKTGLKYTGEAQELVTGGTADTSIEFALGTNADTAPDDGYSATVLSATNAGTYYVWYRATADANHYASDPAVLTVKIAKATQNITAENVTATYGETDKSVSASVTAVTTNVGAISYAVKDGSEDYIDVNAANGALTIKKAGTATVIVTAAETANYAQATKEVTVTINKAGINPKLSIQNKTYDGNEITYTIEDNLGSGTVTSISWEKQNSDENWSTVDDTPVNAGKYRGTATIAETDNYFGANTNTAEFTISKAPINPTVEITGTYTYTGEAIMPTFTVKNGDKTLAETDYTVSYANNINAGENTASVSVSAAEGGNYTFTDVTENFSIAKAAINPTVSIENWVFGTTASTPNVTGNPGNGAVTYTYSSDGTSFSKDVPTAVGSYTIKAAVAETANYLGGETTAIFEITKVPATVTTAPAAKTMKYNGEPQGLVTEGAANGGTMQYSLDGENYSADIPTGTDAKTYTVYYKVVGDANHSDTTAQSVTASIAKADATCTAPTANNLTYTGSAQPLVTAGTANGGTMHYCLDGTSWNAAIPTGTDAGSYTVYYKVVGDGNHNDTEPHNINVNVGKASDKTLANITRSMLRTSASISISVASAVPADVGTISGYALSGTASTNGTVTASNAAVSAGGLVTATLSGGEAGDTITIPVKITAQNYDCTISVIVTLTELADPVFTAPTAQTLTYNGSAQELVTAGTVTTGGTMQYSTDGASWSTTVPTGTNAGSYTVYYKIDETDEVNGVTSTPVNVSIARKAAVVTADNKTRTTLESDPELTATVTGLVGSDTVNYTLSRAAGEDIGTYTITPSGDTEQGNYTVTYQTGTFTITEGVIAVTGITLNKTSTTLTVGGSETLTATVLPADATNKTVTWTSDKTAVATVANGVVAATGAGTAIITAKAGDKTATCIVTVRSSGGSYTPVIPYYPTGGSTTTTTTNTNEPKIEGGSGVSGWSNIASEIGKTPAGGSVTIDMNGTTIVPTNVLNALKGNDVDLVLDIGGGITWTINGKDIESVSGSIDLGVKLGTSDIPVDVVNNVTGEHYSTTIHLNHSGKFGFKAVMTVPLRKQDAGLYANLYYYNPSKKALEFVSSAKIDKNGNAELDFNHASDYAIVIDDHPLGGRDVTAKTTGSKVKLTWDAAPGAESYTVYIKKNGKYKKFKTTSKTALTVSGLKNGKTYEFLIRYSVDGKLSEIADSYKVSVKVCYKPVLKATTKNGTITLKWSAVNNATEYRVVKYTNGEWKLVKETSKLSQTIRGLNSGKTYKYAVQAKVNGKWTTVSTSDIVTVKAK